MTSRKIIIIAIFALALMFLFLALFGNKSYFRTQEVIEKNTELEGKIQEVSYQNARMGSVKDYTANGDVVFANDPDAFQETGYELFSSMTKPYKIFIVIVFTCAAMLVVGALIVIKNYKKTREEYEARELERKAKGEDQIFDDKVVDIRTRDGFNKVCDTIAVGGIAIIPTDTVYGISALMDESNKKRIERIKDRDPNKNFIVLATLSKAKHIFGKNLSSDVYGLWPAPLSVIGLKADKSGTLAVRVPDDRDLERIVNITGPIYSTSVNISGEPPLNDIHAIKSQFGNKVDIIGYNPDAKFSEPSTLLDATVYPFVIRREGAYPREELEAHLPLQD